MLELFLIRSHHLPLKWLQVFFKNPVFHPSFFIIIRACLGQHYAPPNRTVTTTVPVEQQVHGSSMASGMNVPPVAMEVEVQSTQPEPFMRQSSSLGQMPTPRLSNQPTITTGMS